MIIKTNLSSINLMIHKDLFDTIRKHNWILLL